LFASDFSPATADGTILNREQFVSEMMSDSRKAIPPVHVSVKLVRIRVDGETTNAWWSKKTYYSVKAANGATQQLRYPQRFESQLTRVSGKWVTHALIYPAHATR